MAIKEANLPFWYKDYVQIFFLIIPSIPLTIIITLVSVITSNLEIKKENA